MWCVPELDDEYITKMEDVLETYEQPHNPKEPVVCLDEKPVTLHAEVRPASPAQPGREARHDSEYERRGTANVFCAVEPKAGRHFTFATPDRSGFEFAQVVCELALQYPQADTIHLVMDNLNIHRRKSLTVAFGVETGSEIWDRFTVPPDSADSGSSLRGVADTGLPCGKRDCNSAVRDRSANKSKTLPGIPGCDRLAAGEPLHEPPFVHTGGL